MFTKEKPTSRQAEFAERFQIAFENTKKKHGTGTYSWAEGMTRRAARRIARKRARQIMRDNRNAVRKVGSVVQ